MTHLDNKHITISPPGAGLVWLQIYEVPSKADSSCAKINPVKSSRNLLTTFTEYALGPQIWEVIHQCSIREREVSIPIPCDRSQATQRNGGSNMPWPNPTKQLLRADRRGFHHVHMTTVYMD